MFQERVYKMHLKPVPIFMVLILVSGCVSIGNPFLKIKPDYSTVPAEELKAFAREIEQYVVDGEREPAFDTYPSIKADNEEIQQAIRMRAARSHLIQELLNSGFAYEQKAGTIATIRTREYKRATDRHKRDQDALVVINENANRWTLYESLVKASHWQPGALGAVQDAFFEARRDLLAPGQKFQESDDSIVAK